MGWWRGSGARVRRGGRAGAGRPTSAGGRAGARWCRPIRRSAGLAPPGPQDAVGRGRPRTRPDRRTHLDRRTGRSPRTACSRIGSRPTRRHRKHRDRAHRQLIRWHRAGPRRQTWPSPGTHPSRLTRPNPRRFPRRRGGPERSWCPRRPPRRQRQPRRWRSRAGSSGPYGPSEPAVGRRGAWRPGAASAGAAGWSRRRSPRPGRSPPRRRRRAAAPGQRPWTIRGAANVTVRRGRRGPDRRAERAGRAEQPGPMEPVFRAERTTSAGRVSRARRSARRPAACAAGAALGAARARAAPGWGRGGRLPGLTPTCRIGLRMAGRRTPHPLDGTLGPATIRHHRRWLRDRRDRRADGSDGGLPWPPVGRRSRHREPGAWPRKA